MNVIPDSKAFRKLLIFFFAFGLAFPTLRILLIGSATSANALEYFISSLPEFIVLLILAITVLPAFKSNQPIKPVPMDWVVLGFLITNVLLGFLLAQNIKLSLYGFRMSYLPVLFYFVIRFYNVDNNVLKKTLHYIFLSFVLLAAIGLILYFFMPGLMVEMIRKSGGRVTVYFIMRMTSILWTPVVFGTFTVAGFLYFFYKALDNDHWSNYLFMAILWSGTVLCISRGAAISLLFGLIFFSCLFFRIKIIIKTFLVMVAVTMLIANLFENPLEFFVWYWNSSVDTLALHTRLTRVQLWIMGYENLKRHPFGHGLGMSGHVAARFLATSAEEADIYSTDGWYLKLANETGAWGLLSYLALSITYIVLIAKGARIVKDTFLLFLLIFFIVFNVQNVVSNVLDFYLFAYLFWLLAGIAVNQVYTQQFEQH